MGRGEYGLGALLAGLANGYVLGDKMKSDDAERKQRQELHDAQMREIAAKEEDRAGQKALESRLAAIPTASHPDAIGLDAVGLQSAAPQVFSNAQNMEGASPAMSPEEAAQHVLSNGTPEQINNLLQSAQGAGLADLNGQQVVTGTDGKPAMADPSQSVQRPMWEVMRDRAHEYMKSGKGEDFDRGYKMLNEAMKAKSDDYMKRIAEARKGGMPGLLKMLSDHPTEELPYTNIQTVKQQDGTIGLVGQDQQGNTVPIPGVSLRSDPEYGSPEVQLTELLASQVTPERLLQFDADQTRAAIAAQQRKHTEGREAITDARDIRDFNYRADQDSKSNKRADRQLSLSEASNARAAAAEARAAEEYKDNAPVRAATRQEKLDEAGFNSYENNLAKSIIGKKDTDPGVQDVLDKIAVSRRARTGKGEGRYTTVKDEDGKIVAVNNVSGEGHFVTPTEQPSKPGGVAVTPPQAAIDALAKDPSLAAQFDAKYGAGSSKKYLRK